MLRAVVVPHCATELVEPDPVLVLGMDKPRFGRRRRPQGLSGQVDGRTSAAVQAWLGARTLAFRDGVEVLVVNPQAGYAAAVRTALHEAVVAVDHFHLVMLASKAVTAARQRVTRELLGRRRGKLDPT